MARKPIIEKEWVSDFGTIQVGDPVVVITEGYSHRISIRKGTYLGYIDQGTCYWNKKPKYGVKVLVEKERWSYFVGDKEVKWNHPDGKGRNVKYVGETTLQLNRIIPLPKGTEDLIEKINKLV